MTKVDLVAIRIERRRIAVAAFCGTRLDYLQVRELSANRLRAAKSARRFIAWLSQVLAPDTVALEEQPAISGRARERLYDIITDQVRASFTAQVEVHPSDLREDFGVPPLRSRMEVREVGRRLWPERLADLVQPAAYDAAALGLHIQMAALFSHK